MDMILIGVIWPCQGPNCATQITFTILETNIYPYQGTFEDDFSFPQVRYVSSLEGKPRRYWMLLGLELIHALRRCAHGKKSGIKRGLMSWISMAILKRSEAIETKLDHEFRCASKTKMHLNERLKVVTMVIQSRQARRISEVC